MGGTGRNATRSQADQLEVFVTIRKLVSQGVMLVMLVFAAGIAYGDPPPKQGTEPGVVVHLAAAVPGRDPGGGSPGIAPAAGFSMRLSKVLADGAGGSNGDIHIGSATSSNAHVGEIMVAHLADCTDENCLPPIKPRLVLAARGQIHVAECTDEQCLPGTKPKLVECTDDKCVPGHDPLRPVLAATNGQIHVGRLKAGTQLYPDGTPIVRD
jgi:hypothetical protein